LKVILAGYNFDVSQISNKEILYTPETISAAYARISRSKKSVDELRADALEDVEKARHSNKNIVFEMGHSSVAEHAVFNFDIIGISRYLTEFVQQTRLASFTEKSQRYVTVDGDYVIPEEIKNDRDLFKEFKKTINTQNETYSLLFKELQTYFLQTTDLVPREREGKAKEDARYVLSMATQTQMGMTINARSLERLLRRLYALPLFEAKQLADSLQGSVEKITPSLIRYIEPSTYDMRRYRKEVLSESENAIPRCKLIMYSKNSDERIIAALLFRSTGNDFDTVMKDVKRMNNRDKEEIVKRFLNDITCHDSFPREFEVSDFLYQVNISASCFAQLKRHRLATIITTDYDSLFGYTIPQSIKNIMKQDRFKQVMKESEKTNHVLATCMPEVKNYILTNAHHKLVLFKSNMRELCHFARLRQDIHAQWDIRDLADKIIDQARNVAPLTTLLICGKDQFPVYKEKIDQE